MGACSVLQSADPLDLRVKNAPPLCASLARVSDLSSQAAAAGFPGHSVRLSHAGLCGDVGPWARPAPCLRRTTVHQAAAARSRGFRPN